MKKLSIYPKSNQNQMPSGTKEVMMFAMVDCFLESPKEQVQMSNRQNSRSKHIHD
jgi:hypothetical protein